MAPTTRVSTRASKLPARPPKDAGVSAQAGGTGNAETSLTKRRSEVAPDAGYVEALYRVAAAQGPEVALRQRIIHARRLQRLQLKPDIPVQYRATTKDVRTPFFRDACHRVTAAMTRNAPMVHIEPADETQDAQNAANIGERWDTQALVEIGKATKQNLPYESMKAMVRDTESVVKVVCRTDAWGNFPQRGDESAEDYLKATDRFGRTMPFPFAARVVDRLQMVFGDGEWGDEWAIEYGVYPRPYLHQKYGVILDPESDRMVRPEYVLGGKPVPEGYLVSSTGQSIKLEYQSAQWWHVVIDGQDAPGFPKPNPYAPDLCYCRARPDEDNEGVLFALQSLVPALDSVLTMWMNWMYLGSYPTPTLEPVPNPASGGLADYPVGEDGQPVTFTWSPGKLFQPPVGWKFGFLSPPPMGADARQMVSYLRDMIDIAGIPNVMRGNSGSGDSGYLANQMVAAATITYQLLGLAGRRQLEEMFEKIHRWVRKLVGAPVYVHASNRDGDARSWLSIKPDGAVTEYSAPVTEFGPLSVEYRPVLPTDEQARAMIAQQLSAGGPNGEKQLISKRYAREHYLQVEDSQGMDDEIAVENALDRPPLSDIVLQQALKEAGLLPQGPSGLVDVNGNPLSSGSLNGLATPPGGAPTQSGAGAMASPPGLPFIPGMDQGAAGPPTPTPPVAQPNGVAAGVGGRPAGAYPGQPGNQGPPLP